VLVKVGVKSLNSGRFQICVGKPQSNPQPVQTSSSLEQARRVLLELGIDQTQVDATLNLIPDVGPNQPLHFSPLEVPQSILWDHGFKL
jgi:hypothetical protein